MSAVELETVVRAGRHGALDEEVERVDDEQSAHQHTQSDADTIRQSRERRRTGHAF